MTSEQTIAKIDAALPRMVKDALQRAGFQLGASIEKFIDENGPATYPSTSARWGAQTGRATRSFVPGQPDNIMLHTQSGGRFSLTWGTEVPYVRFLEEGTKFMRARPALTPGFADFEREQMPKLLDSILKEVAGIFNR